MNKIMACKELEEVIKKYTLEELFKLIDHGKAIELAIREKKLSDDKLISLILCDDFKKYMDDLRRRNYEYDDYINELYTVFKFIHTNCSSLETRKIIKNVFCDSKITNTFIEYIYESNEDNNCELFKLMKIILFCKDIFNDWRRSGEKYSYVLNIFGIKKKHPNMRKQHFSFIGDNVIQSTKIFKRFMRKIDYLCDDRACCVRNIQLMKYFIKQKLDVFCGIMNVSYNNKAIAGLCYIYKLSSTFKTKYNIHAIPFGLIHRKSLDVIDDETIKNKTKKVYNFVSEVLMKFSSKNCSKMILYYV